MCVEAIIQNMKKGGIPAGGRTLRGRLVEYRDLLERYIGSLAAQAGHTRRADGMRYRARDGGGWMPAMMDGETRFIPGVRDVFHKVRA